MAVSNTTKREIRQTHPGEMLREDFMPDYDLNNGFLGKGYRRITSNNKWNFKRTARYQSCHGAEIVASFWQFT